MRARRRGARLAVPAMAVALLVSLPVPAPAAAEEIRIVRDSFGVPHVFAETEEGAAFGAGYALGQDRLWQMHVFRRIAKGQLSEIFGPSVVGIDKTVRFWTYTEEERARRYRTYPADVRGLLEAFVDGINAWIDVVRTDPRKLPFEFVEFGIGMPDDWTVDDSLALQDVLILSFGSGGGGELGYAALLQRLVERYGEDRGLAMFDDLVLTNDPDAPTTIPRGYPYWRRPTFGRDGESEARRALEDDARLGLGDPSSDGSSGAATASSSAAVGTRAQLGLLGDLDAVLPAFRQVQRGMRSLERIFSFGSNAQIAGPKHAEAGNSVQTGGPQVGYLLPQWLADFGMHGGDLDTTGMTFAGAGPAVLIGRGPGYAWTTTTGASDLTDTYVERLNPADPREYQFAGSFEPMDCRTETYTFRGVPFDSQEICRTRHGPVLAFDEANDVAYSLRYAWFNREGQTVEGFFRYNEVRSVEDFATFANFLSSNHNMFYTDDQGHYAYWHPANFPVRAPGVDLRLPQDGTGGSEWRGLLPVDQTPHAVDFGRGWLANWNNQPAQPWDRERAHPALDNALDLIDALDPRGRPLPDPFGGTVNPDGRLSFQDLSANLRYGAFKHHTDTYFRRFLPRDRTLETDLARAAAEAVRLWNGHLTDLDGDGLYDSAGRTILDRWVSVMRNAAFGDELGFLGSGDFNRFAAESLLWHVLNRRDRLGLGVDWLNGGSATSLAAAAFEEAVGQLAEEFGSQDASSWRQKAALQHYQRINADTFPDLAQQQLGRDSSDDSGFPGDVRDHIRMDRGTYNHVVVYRDRPTGSGVLGESASEAGSVIPPGQSGFIDPLGREDAHYEDQWALYVEWRYKPMPLTLEEALAVAESDETVAYRG